MNCTALSPPWASLGPMGDNEASKKSFMDNTLHALFDQLEARLSGRQVYRVNPNYGFNDLEKEYNSLQIRSHDLTRLPPDYDEEQELFFCSDMCVRGPGGHEALGQQLGIPLPADYLEFTRRYSEYLLASRCPVRIENAQSAGDMTRALRLSCNLPLGPPYVLFVFSVKPRDPSEFLFRWSPDFQKMDVVICEDYGDYGEPELLGPEGDQYVTDASFTAWLQRMLDTEGYPLFPGKPNPLDGCLTRLK